MNNKRRNKFSLKNVFSTASSALAAVFVSISLACGGNPALQNNANSANSAPEVKLTAVERDIKSMETANFNYIFVFRRKDGGVLDGEDKKFLKDNSPAETNRFVLSDQDKAVVAGSSFEFEPKILEKLGERFNIENFSSAKAVENNNVNQANNDNNINK